MPRISEPEIEILEEFIQSWSESDLRYASDISVEDKEECLRILEDIKKHG